MGARSNRSTSTASMTRAQWVTVNEALALLEAHMDDQIADGFSTCRDLARLERVREIVLDVLNR